jgi:uncharacterized protein (TIGR03086 family)
MVGLTGAVALLERAVEYGLKSVEAIEQDTLARPTPCAGWDLESLLCHVNESMAALTQGADGGGIDLVPSTGRGTLRGGRAEDLVAAFRAGSCRMLDGWRRMTGDSAQPNVAGTTIAGGTVAMVGAVELAVHGWDIAEACGARRPIPEPLALDILHWTPLIVEGGTRPTLFAEPVRVPRLASPSDRLVAFLGRSPHGWAAAETALT